MCEGSVSLDVPCPPRSPEAPPEEVLRAPGIWRTWEDHDLDLSGHRQTDRQAGPVVPQCGVTVNIRGRTWAWIRIKVKVWVRI